MPRSALKTKRYTALRRKNNAQRDENIGFQLKAFSLHDTTFWHWTPVVERGSLSEQSMLHLAP